MWLSLRLICQIRFSSCCCRCCWTLAAVLSHYCSPVRNTWDYRDEQQKNEIEEFYAKTRKPRESFEINTNLQSVRECARSMPLAYSSHLLLCVFFFSFSKFHIQLCVWVAPHTHLHYSIKIDRITGTVCWRRCAIQFIKRFVTAEFHGVSVLIRTFNAPFGMVYINNNNFFDLWILWFQIWAAVCHFFK